MSKGFFGKWKDGTMNYANTMEGQLTSKKWFMRIVIVGLVGGSIQRLYSHDYFMSLVLIGFAGIMIIDYRNIMKQLGSFRRL